MRPWVLAALVLISASVLPLPAAAGWHAVPGAPEVEADVASLQGNAEAVTTWLRYAGHHPGFAPLAAWAGVPPRSPHRTMLQVRLDCHRRTLQSVAAQAFRDGRVVAMASVPGRVLPVPGDVEVTAFYDAICELARRDGG